MTQSDPMEVENDVFIRSERENKEKKDTLNKKNLLKGLDVYNLKIIYFRFFVIYYILALFSFYFLYLQSYTNNTKIMIALTILLFPFVIYILEVYLYNLLYYLYVFILTKPYEGDHDY
jgi:hypothetical protein